MQGQVLCQININELAGSGGYFSPDDKLSVVMTKDEFQSENDARADIKGPVL